MRKFPAIRKIALVYLILGMVGLVALMLAVEPRQQVIQVDPALQIVATVWILMSMGIKIWAFLGWDYPEDASIAIYLALGLIFAVSVEVVDVFRWGAVTILVALWVHFDIFYSVFSRRLARAT